MKHRPPTKKAPNDCNKPLNGDILMLTETDIPGASLNGKSPNQLTVVQLKRWLVCRGAPISGKKSDLIERSVVNSMLFPESVSRLCICNLRPVLVRNIFQTSNS